MKKVAVFMLALTPVLLVIGCKSEKQAVAMRMQNKQNLMKLSNGMTRDEVLDLMGDTSVTVGMGKSATTVTNPQERKQVTINGKEYEILYYYTDFKQHDWPTKRLKVLDTELTPVVLEQDKVIGWSQDFVDQLRAAQ